MCPRNSPDAAVNSCLPLPRRSETTRGFSRTRARLTQSARDLSPESSSLIATEVTAAAVPPREHPRRSWLGPEWQALELLASLPDDAGVEAVWRALNGPRR